MLAFQKIALWFCELMLHKSDNSIEIFLLTFAAGELSLHLVCIEMLDELSSVVPLKDAVVKEGCWISTVYVNARLSRGKIKLIICR